MIKNRFINRILFAVILNFHITEGWICEIDQKSQKADIYISEKVPLFRHQIEFPTLFLGNADNVQINDHDGNFNISQQIWRRNPITSMFEHSIETHSNGHHTCELIFEQATLRFVSDANQSLIEIHLPENSNDLPKPNRIWLRFYAEPDEMVYGGGEQYSHFNMRHRRFPIWTREQGVGRDPSGIVTFLLNTNKGGAGGDYHTTYFPQPSFVSSRSYFCHLLPGSSPYSAMDFTGERFHEIEIWHQADNHTFSCVYDTGGLPAVFRDQSEHFGRQPILPKWIVDGITLASEGGSQKLLVDVNRSMEYEIPARAFWIQDWSGIIKTSFGTRVYWDWKWSEEHYPDLPQIMAYMKSQGIRLMAYINPHLIENGSLYREADGKGFLLKRCSTNSTLLQDFGEFNGATVDFTNPMANKWYKNVMTKNLVNFGFSGWMADFGEYTPYSDVCAHDQSIDPTILHNIYPVLWAKLNREVVEEAGQLGEIVFFMRSGSSGAQNQSLLMWAGDQNVDFSLADGIPSVIPSALSLAASGFGLTHWDIGGYTGLKTPAPLPDLVRTAEVLLRSAEMAVFSPVMRTHVGNLLKENTQYYDSTELLNAFRRLSMIHQCLTNYTMQLINDNHHKGEAVIRPMFLDFTYDPVCLDLQYQYMFGSELLVAPVIHTKKLFETIYLPRGEWVSFWNSTLAIKSDGTFMAIDSEIGYPPVFYQKGTASSDLFANCGSM